VRRQGARKHRAVWRWLTAAAVLAALSVGGAVGAAGQTAGEVSGTVVNATTGDAVPGVSVVLEASESLASAPAARTTRTGADGGFTFDDVAADAEGTYVVTASFEGVDYRSVAFEVPTDGPVTLEVFDTTTSDDDVVVRSWVVWVDRERGVAVQHDLQIENAGELTYVGTEEALGGSSRVITVPLAPGAEDLQFLGRFTECCAELRGETALVHTAPLAPGTVTGTLRYTIPTLDRLELPVFLPTDNFSLLVPAGTRVESDLQPAGETESRGTTYEILRATDLAAGERIVLGFPEMGPLAWSPVLVPIGIALGVLAIGLAVLAWRLRRDAPRRRTKAPSSRTNAPAAERADTVASNGHSGIDRAELLVEEIALLDLAFDRGLVSRELYEPLRAERKADLLLLRRPTPTPSGKGVR
jgi:hypothetical protein